MGKGKKYGIKKIDMREIMWMVKSMGKVIIN